MKGFLIEAIVCMRVTAAVEVREVCPGKTGVGLRIYQARVEIGRVWERKGFVARTEGDTELYCVKLPGEQCDMADFECGDVVYASVSAQSDGGEGLVFGGVVTPEQFGAYTDLMYRAS